MNELGHVEDSLWHVSALCYVLLSAPFSALTKLAQEDFKLTEIILILIISGPWTPLHATVVIWTKLEAVPGHLSSPGLLLPCGTSGVLWYQQSQKEGCFWVFHPATHSYLIWSKFWIFAILKEKVHRWITSVMKKFIRSEDTFFMWVFWKHYWCSLLNLHTRNNDNKLTKLYCH